MLTQPPARSWARPSAARRVHRAEDTVDLSACDFDNLLDEGELRYFNELPTSFQLESEAVDPLRAAARTLLRKSPEFQVLRRKLGGEDDG